MSASKIRFSAAHIFYATALAAASTALFSAWGLPLAAFIALIWWQIFSGAQREARQIEGATGAPESCDPGGRRGTFKIELVVVLLMTAMLLGLLLPAKNDADPMRHAETSMQMVAKAIREYQASCGMYPPPVIYDAEGKAAHSWRALILEQLGEEKLAAAYRWDEPWDGPHNSQLAKYRPWHYRPFYSTIDGHPTSLHVVMNDGRFVVAEHEQIQGNWMEPTNVTLRELGARNELPELDQGFWSRGFFWSTYRGRLAVNDEQTWIIQPGASIDAVVRPADENTVHIGTTQALYHPFNAIRLGVFLFVALYPIRWLRRT